MSGEGLFPTVTVVTVDGQLKERLRRIPSFEEIVTQIEKSGGRIAEPVHVMQLCGLYRAHVRTMAAQKALIAELNAKLRKRASRGG